MKVILTLIFGCLFLSAVGQAKVSNDTLLWNASRPLTWADFKGEPLEGIGMTGEAFCMNLANFARPNAFQKTKFTVMAVFDRKTSWMNPEGQSDMALLYFQTMFNIYEVHARRLRMDLAGTKFKFDPTAQFQEKYNNSMTELMNEFNQFRRETKLGSEHETLVAWKLRVDQELNALAEFAE